MVYIPTRLLKKLTSVAVLLITAYAYGQAPDRQLLLGDSLFLQKRYTQAFQTYQAVEQQGYCTDAMLLRMAFIQEGLGHTAESLLYLNRYWLATGDPQVIEKIQEVAQKKNLSGYDYDSIDQLRLQLAHIRLPLAIGGSAIVLLLLSLSVYLTRIQHQGRWFSLAASVFVATLAAYGIWAAQPPAFAISQPAAYLMEGPSPGSSVLARIEQGHRLLLKGEKDIWLISDWNGREVFVRKSSVQLVQ
jgi:hypothetical protein